MRRSLGGGGRNAGRAGQFARSAIGFRSGGLVLDALRHSTVEAKNAIIITNQLVVADGDHDLVLVTGCPCGCNGSVQGHGGGGDQAYTEHLDFPFSKYFRLLSLDRRLPLRGALLLVGQKVSVA